MNGISNGDGTYKQLSNSDALVGMASDLPDPQKSVTENIKDLKVKTKDYSVSSGGFGHFQFSSVLSSNQIPIYVTANYPYSILIASAYGRVIDATKTTNANVPNVNVNGTIYYVEV